jgi:hypothetical protein
MQGLQTLGVYAFGDCTRLAAIDMSGMSALQVIGDCAFYCCTSLTSANFSGLDSLAHIGGDFLEGCDAMAAGDLAQLTELRKNLCWRTVPPCVKIQWRAHEDQGMMPS